MNVVLVQNMLHLPTYGGANSSNRLITEAIVREGHTCSVVAPALGPGAALTRESGFLDALDERRLTAQHPTPNTYTVDIQGVTLHAVVPTAQTSVMQGLSDTLDRVVSEDTDWVIASIDDGGTMLLEAAHRARPGRVVCLSHTSTALPFGPMSPTDNEAATRLMQRCAAVLTNTECMQEYLDTWGNIGATVTAVEPFQAASHPNFASFDDGYVTMLNPCDLKGIPIFLELADRFPDVDFAGVPTWGTTAADRAAMQNRPNVDVLDPVDDIDEVYAQTRILLMPSLWLETFGRCATEAMQRGLPVLASDHGGLPEAKGGVDYLLPVRPIESVGSDVSERGRVVPDQVPDQDIDPWAEALERLLTDRAHYDDLSRRSREAAAEVAAQNRPETVVNLLDDLLPTKEARRADASDEDDPPTESASDALDEETRRLLALRALRRNE